MKVVELGPDDPPLRVPKEAVAASLTLRDAATWTQDGRKEIARWLRRQAYLIEKRAGELSPEYRARYLTRDVEDAMDVTGPTDTV